MSKARQLCGYALRYEGWPYRWGAKGPNYKRKPQDAFDCSGLTWDAYHSVGIDIPHGSRAQAKFSRRIPLGAAAMNPGCLVFKAILGVVYHVGLILENGRMIEAKGKKYGVIVHPFVAKEWSFAGKVDSLYR